MSNRVGDCFKFLWTFHNVRTLPKISILHKVSRVCTYLEVWNVKSKSPAKLSFKSLRLFSKLYNQTHFSAHVLVWYLKRALKIVSKEWFHGSKAKIWVYRTKRKTRKEKLFFTPAHRIIGSHWN